MKINEVTQPFGKQETDDKPTKKHQQRAIKSYKDIDKLKPKDDEEFISVKVNKGK